MMVVYMDESARSPICAAQNRRIMHKELERFGHVTRAKTRNWVGSFLPLMFSASCSFIFAGTERGKGRIRENEAESLRGVIRENGSKKLGLPSIQQRLRATRNLARFQLAIFFPDFLKIRSSQLFELVIVASKLRMRDDDGRRRRASLNCH